MSIANLESKALFIHVPKTAGTSMEMKPFIGGAGHQGIKFFKRAFKLSIIGIDYDSLFKFGFVRHPYDRFLSAATSYYMGHHTNEFGWGNYPLTKEGVNQFLDDHFPKIKDSKIGKEGVHFVPQYKFLTFHTKGAEGLGWKDVGVDFVGRFENLDHDWKVVCDKLGIEDSPQSRLDHHRRNPFTNYREILDDRSKGMLYALYEEDFKIFDYDR